ncbi:peptide chain release factor N(5)-glutamine methyltransferase [Magnetospirillum fulvum]|uniref:Release factor glutamine methyltransferase n=1 Tax=Magnetospirillum fulvum MGU-K5 TaxID=1316936 RepID=S9TEX2_MAGFU|nr:peptide chain release factor N(5)-glutamine methyltransferase [Magnetospirillum fulvum]EPY00796.1 methylase of polypeptide chain release factor [Magnetospirillum fulvum MGU-K5]
MPTLGEALREGGRRLGLAGIDTATFDARLLLAEVTGFAAPMVSLRGETVMEPEAASRFEALLIRREGREPMSHILGRRGFWTLDLAVTAATLDPRPDTETLVEAVLAEVRDRKAPLRLLDFGTGSGCILLALLSELPASIGLGIDASRDALAVAIGNADSCGLSPRAQFRLGDWGQGIGGRFDVIVSNPPYIPEAEIDTLAPEVARFEPRSALSGGADGLECYRRLIPDIARLLSPRGVAALEVGQGQAAAVAALMEDAGLGRIVLRCDLGGIERCVVAFAPES